MQSRRDELRKQKTLLARDWLDCTKCLEINSQVKRRSLHCGHLPSRTWYGPGFAQPPSWPKRIGTVCPGYLVRLPQVCEVAEAYQWWDTGQISQWLDGRPISSHLKASIGVLKSAMADVEADMMTPKE